MDTKTRLNKNQLVEKRFYNILYNDDYWGKTERFALWLNNGWAHMFLPPLVPLDIVDSINFNSFINLDLLEIYNVTDWVNDLYFELLDTIGYKIVNNKLERVLYNQDFNIYPGDKFYGISLLQTKREDDSLLTLINRPNSININLDILSHYDFIKGFYVGVGGKEYIIALPFDDNSIELYKTYRKTCINWYRQGTYHNFRTEEFRFGNYKPFNVIDNENRNENN